MESTRAAAAAALTCDAAMTIRPIVAESGGGVEIRVRVQPRASRSEVVGAHGDSLRVRLAAPPVDGAANEALVELLADALGVPKRAVEIRRGHSGRTKVVRAEGVDEPAARRRLGL